MPQEQFFVIAGASPSAGLVISFTSFMVALLSPRTRARINILAPGWPY
jgi:hypothetical protein